MAHHENSHDDHGHDMTEGNRQYYPKGWFIPLVGLFVVAFFISLGAGALLGISGTDKWGKTEQCTDEHCDGHCGNEHGGMHTDGDHHDGDHHDGDHHHNAAGTTSTSDVHHNDSANVAVAPPADCTKVDSPKKAEPAGH